MTETLSSSPDMRIPINPARASDLHANLATVLSRVQSAYKSAPSSSSHSRSLPPRLVAVSKLKPASDILALHSPPSSHTHFGENYVQELLEKSQLLPPTINWHFIGGLQSNKCRQLARECRNLWAVESVDSIKKARELNRGRAELLEREPESRPRHDLDDDADPSSTPKAGTSSEKLRIFIQINTSNEDNKSGLDPNPANADLIDLCRFILTECPHLHLQGFMTIGALARSQATTPETVNEDFECLRATRDRVLQELKGGSNDGKNGDDGRGDDGSGTKLELELSMGMSEDFEGAIHQGSDEVRVGSTIFGQRLPKSEAKVL